MKRPLAGFLIGPENKIAVSAVGRNRGCRRIIIANLIILVQIIDIVRYIHPTYIDSLVAVVVNLYPVVAVAFIITNRPIVPGHPGHKLIDY